MEIKNKEIAFSTLFFSYCQLKLAKMPLYACKPPHMDENRSAWAAGRTAIRIERYVCSSLPGTSRREEDHDIRRRKLSRATFCEKSRRLKVLHQSTN